MTQCSLIVATDRKGTIGKAGVVPWSSPRDMNWFRMHTLGKPCLVGRKTNETLPNGLKDRSLLEVKRGTRNECSLDWLWDATNLRSEQFQLHRDIMVIGGAQIYEMFMPEATRIYLTTVDTEIVATTEEPLTMFKFPDWTEWESIYKVHDHDQRGKVLGLPEELNLTFQIFQRKYKDNAKQ